VLVRDFHIPADDLHVLFEIFDKLFVLLVAPCRPERMQLGTQRSKPLFQLLVELLEILGKPPQFVRRT